MEESEDTVTDDEILQSKIDHWHQWTDIVKLVRENTPSGVMLLRSPLHRKPLLAATLRQLPRAPR